MAYLPRGLEDRLRAKLGVEPVVVLEGARATGKTSLVQQAVSQGWLTESRSFADQTELAAASAAPQDYVRQLPFGTAIDEAQLCEPITLAIKTLIDEDPTPGRFLLTGSTRLRRNALGGSDPLAGRTGRPRVLAPMTLGERVGAPVNIVDDLFDREPSELDIGELLSRSGLVDAIKQPGLPAMVSLDASTQAERAQSYVPSVTSLQAFESRNIAGVNSLARYLASRTSTLVNNADFAAGAEVSRPTVAEYLSLLEEALLINRLPGWRRSKDKSETDKAKIHFFDTGVAAALSRTDLSRDPQALGRLAETLVINEMSAQSSWCERPPDLYHWRQRRDEVDLVLEHPDGRVVCVEVKSAESVGLDDFRGIDAFRRKNHEVFHRGFVFYTGASVAPFGDERWAIPFAALRTMQPEQPLSDPIADAVASIAGQREAGLRETVERNTRRDDFIKAIDRALDQLGSSLDGIDLVRSRPTQQKLWGTLSGTGADSGLGQVLQFRFHKTNQTVDVLVGGKGVQSLQTSLDQRAADEIVAELLAVAQPKIVSKINTWERKRIQSSEEDSPSP